MSKVYRISILVILVTVVVMSLFIRFRIGQEQKKEKTNVVNQTTITSPQSKKERVAEAKQEEKQTKVVNQSAITSPKSKTEASTKKESKKVLPTLMLISTSQACGCTLEECWQAESIVGEIIKQFSGKINYKVIDHAKERRKVNELARQHKLRFLPTLLFFDRNGRFKSKIEDFSDEENIWKELSSLGD